MRLKLVATSSAAEALYDYLLSLEEEEAGEVVQQVAYRKLTELHDSRRARSAAAAYSSRPHYFRVALCGYSHAT